MLTSLGSLLTGLLNSTQLQSIGRTALKIGGALLINKYGADPSSIGAIAGGLMAASGVVSSIKAHASIPSVDDIVTATVQTVLAATPIAQTPAAAPAPASAPAAA